MRAFAGIGLGDEAARDFRQLQTELRSHFPGVSWARPGDVHITLAFFAELAEADVAVVKSAMEAAATVSAPRLRLLGTGSFPDDRRPRVLWCGIEDEGGRLQAAHDAMSRALRDTAVKLDDKPFAPHCTLGRVRHALSSEALAYWQGMRAAPFSTEWWSPAGLTLFESRGGYHPLIRVPFAI